MQQRTRAAVVGSLVLLASAGAAGHPTQAPEAHGAHAIVRADSITWRPLRPGAEIAVVGGDPDAAGAPFVIRMRYRGKVRVPPHWHPTDEHITVLSGTFMVGMGGRYDESAAIELSAGGYMLVPARMAHFAWSAGDTVVQVHGLGPFAINYVNPDDDPRR
ncbi:MAG TPA: cupin domain-containing protein [Vicinamibacterales bacterium]|nr:cupin domain-containing protein [Vicinamibacterales bacterium]